MTKAIAKAKPIDHGKAARIDRAKGKARGMNVCMLRVLSEDEQTLLRDATELAHNAENGLLADLLDHLSEALLFAAGENEAIKSDGDMRAWAQEQGFVGTAFPCRFIKGKDAPRKAYTRGEQTVIKDVIG